MHTSLFEDGSEDMENPGFVKLAVIPFAKSARAVGIDTGVKRVWVPKSVMTEPSVCACGQATGDHCVTISVKEWFAKKEGLI